jgi:hypothetical protein
VVAVACRGLPGKCRGGGEGYSRLEELWETVVPVRLRATGRVPSPGFFALQERVGVDWKEPIDRGTWEDPFFC